ncbi:4-hydroxythreonine-4-phosphate dehydrogenase PdxA [Oryzibacter oryziterrae]|uniref:4-hydroxythreonine-4-phosphate dehydrogenase PdxA n=1 Tax=Oryzibacter oryziterrae TaxID=2766474 RepID=UPI001F031852|nr:4-hydroxythreonine-4-phosphate dehydrogenase PdxA [Oryzibacter oryziterrae]
MALAQASGTTCRLPLAISAGEPAGIGVEIVARAWSARGDAALPPFYLVGDEQQARARLSHLGLDLPVAVVTPGAAANAFSTALPLVQVGPSLTDRPGVLAPETAASTIAWIETAVLHVRDGLAGALVTAPIQKSQLYAAGFTFPGHTEFLGELAGKLWPGVPNQPVMMLAGPDLSTVPVTVHIPLADVSKTLTREMIVSIGQIVDRDLRQRFGLATPRLSVAGLNPHAGESGTMGREDQDIVAPAVADLQARGIDASGPWPSDTLFHGRARRRYDVVLAMYHDQALIPVKTIAFDETVNVTLGLPFIRTSPDHGTALDIAGKGIANPDSMIAAIRLAGRMAAEAGA